MNKIFVVKMMNNKKGSNCKIKKNRYGLYLEQSKEYFFYIKGQKWGVLNTNKKLFVFFRYLLK